MKKNLAILALILGFSFSLSAQTTSYSGIKRVYSTGVQAIIENHEVKGYYVFYFLDKASGKENLYSFNLLDQNLVQTHTVELSLPKREILMEISYNGERFCLSFLEPKERYINYMLLDKTGKQAGSYKVTDLSKSEVATISQMLATENDNFSGALSAVQGKGFVRYGVEREKGMRVEIEMFDNDGKKKWTATTGATSKKSYETATPICSNSKYIVTNFGVRDKIFDGSPDMYIGVNDADSGKELYRITTKTPNYLLNCLGINYDETTNELFDYGEYYAAKTNPASDRSTGFYVRIIDAATGTLKKESYSLWANDIDKFMPVNDDGKKENYRSVTIHRMVRTADGKIYAIGEQFKKAVSGLGVAAGILGGSNSNVSMIKVNLYDIFLFEFTSDLKISKVHVFDKDKTSIELPRGMGMVPKPMLATMMKTYGWFDYCFTTESPDKKQFNVVYTNYDRDKEEGNKYIIGNISYTKEGKLVADKVAKNSKSSLFIAVPAKPGYIAVFEYFRKGKKMELRLEKLNI